MNDLGKIPILCIHRGIIIRAHPTRLIAETHSTKFPGTYDSHEKQFPHVDNLYDLPLRGLLRLAEEFYSELTQTKGLNP